VTSPLTDEEIQQLRELCEKATPGPWEIEFDDGVGMDPDSTFIVAARTALPRLLDKVERLKEENSRLTPQCEGCITGSDLGVPEYGSHVAHAHPKCPIHGMQARLPEENARLKKANEQTIEVLGRFPGWGEELPEWKRKWVKPLLDNLIALRDGAPDEQFKRGMEYIKEAERTAANDSHRIIGEAPRDGGEEQ